MGWFIISFQSIRRPRAFTFLTLVAACAANFKIFNGNCYLFPTVRRDWTAARAMCNAQSPRSHIVVINNPMEENWVIHDDRIADTTSGSWMGCSDADSEGHWVCDDTSVTITYWNTVSDHQGYWGNRKYYIIKKVKIHYSKNPKQNLLM